METEWVRSHAYKFTKPVSTKRLSLPLRVALLLAEGSSPKSRTEVLKLIGMSDVVANRKGQYTGIFTALNWNQVVVYDKKSKTYTKGKRFKEYMQFTLTLMVANPEIKKKFKKEYLQVLKCASNAAHFIMAE